MYYLTLCTPATQTWTLLSCPPFSLLLRQVQSMCLCLMILGASGEKISNHGSPGMLFLCHSTSTPSVTGRLLFQSSTCLVMECQGHSTLSSQHVFEDTQLTQLVQLVTANRLFPCHKGRVDLSNKWVPLSLCMVWSQRILTPSKPSSPPNGLEWKENGCDAEGTQNIVSSWP